MARFTLGLLPYLLLTACTGDDKGDTDNTVGDIDTSSAVVDYDQDGFPDDEDCNDNDPTIHPGADELCDSVDNNCDGLVDEEVTNTYYRDADGDGFGDPDELVEACTAPAGYVPTASDCDDSNTEAYPGNAEVCDNIDNDCDGDIDEDVSTTYYADSDVDGYGDPENAITACSQPTGYVEDASDCDDTTDQAFPGNLEICDDIDNDCDGSVDEDVTTTYYVDLDSDGWGDSSATEEACSQPTGYAKVAGDCDDGSAVVNPDATEECDLIDNDCDGSTDEDDAIDVSTWYADTDGDTYGDASSTDIDCYQPTGYVADDTDCDDTNGTTYPGADEYCDGEDDNCDGDIDEDTSVDVSTWYQDVDSDGFGDASSTDIDCYQPSGFVADDTDCDDDENTVYPGASEVCDGQYNDCDDSSYTAGSAPSDELDDDSDTFVDCTIDAGGWDGSGAVSGGDDCDDAENTVYPGASEVCDGQYNDCSDSSYTAGSAPSDELDDDGDAYVECIVDGGGWDGSSAVSGGEDCDDADYYVWPGATEICDGQYNDCTDSSYSTTTAPSDETDDDGDTYVECTIDSSGWVGSGSVTGGDDCHDAENTVYPGAPEICDGQYNDCDDPDYDASSAPDDELDNDGDGFVECEIDPSGWDGDSGVTDGDDCDDGDDEQYPGADEVCNSEDDDCDGDIDEDGEVTDGNVYYADVDGDELGDADSTIDACSAPSGYVDNDYDCNDSDATEPVVVDVGTGSASGSGSLSDPFDIIQDGIDDADECVIVYAGTYKETIDLDGKDLEIWGVEGADYTTIDGDGTVCSASSPTGCSAVVTSNSGAGATAELIGFTITGGTGAVTTTSSSTTCADSSASHAGDNTCTVNVYEYWGGGVFVDGDDLTLTDCVVEDNTLPEFEQAEVGDFEQNWLYSYGGGIAVLNGTLTLDGVEVYENYADQGGGIFVSDSGNADLLHSVVTGNSAEDGAGALVEDASSLTANNTAFACNEAATDGGGVFASDASTVVDLTNVILAKNESSTGTTHGSQIYTDSSVTVSMMNSIGWSTIAAYAIYGSGTGSFTYSDVYNSDTTSYTYGGGYTAGTGGISSDPDLGSVTCDGNPNNDDFSLDSTSPAIDAGNPSSSYNDDDGTTNDMGVYGGPSGSW